MAAVSAPPQPIITCPYTAGGCPLFQTIDVSESSRCAGSCSPAPPRAPAPLRGYSSKTAPSPKPSTSAATPSSLSSASSRPTPGSYSYDDALLLSELTGEVGLPLPSALLKQDSWSGYLDFGISPDQLEVPFLAPLSGPSSIPLPAAQSPAAASAPKHQLWDIEELIPPEGAKRVRTTPPPVALPGAATSAVGYPQGDLPVHEPPPAAAPRSPSTSDEENEVVTPFISKLSYLLQHQEYEAWVRWDASGQYLLVAHTKPHLLHILERFFRHTVTSSFIRQLNIYGFKRASTAQLLNILDATPFAPSVTLPDGTAETFSAADFSAFSNPAFFRSVPGGAHCRLGALKPITKERAPRNRKKAATKRKAAGSGSASGGESP
ncbi:hypothetical protein Rhopal_003671-T1 [Rhodotorula paludigena]|uniref:HSF-type DNA-binding domain-containing protein n=1 Tax=Rhodotorula paludigena TaxID=86838 RepID=A0AAV5GL83_9BASI|nr:hypothetical protein Rhopal_003671-T1 [Rhodotorula paludigena]